MNPPVGEFERPLSQLSSLSRSGASLGKNLVGAEKDQAGVGALGSNHGGRLKMNVGADRTALRRRAVLEITVSLDQSLTECGFRLPAQPTQTRDIQKCYLA